MSTGRPKTPIILSNDEQKQLQSIARSRSLPYGLVTRARIVLLAAQGSSNKLIAEKVGLSPNQSANGVSAFFTKGLKASTMGCVPGDRDRFQTNKWQN